VACILYGDSVKGLLGGIGNRMVIVRGRWRNHIRPMIWIQAVKILFFFSLLTADISNSAHWLAMPHRIGQGDTLLYTLVVQYSTVQGLSSDNEDKE
jgi:hypothetical protein